MNGERCEYSRAPDMYNLCRYAHSQDELDEWKERYEWRLMKREMARQERVFSYMDELLERYENSADPVNVVSVCLNDIFCVLNTIWLRHTMMFFVYFNTALAFIVASND